MSRRRGAVPVPAEPARPDDARLVVHCHAGVSRSPAAAWLVLVALPEEIR